MLNARWSALLATLPTTPESSLVENAAWIHAWVPGSASIVLPLAAAICSACHRRPRRRNLLALSSVSSL